MRAATRWFCLTKASLSAATRWIVLVFSTLVAGMLALAAPASATTETFNFTGAAQTWPVPDGVFNATFDLYGAQGGGDTFTTVFLPGLGGRATATIPLTPGDSIQVTVGGQGGGPDKGGPGGFNGGGSASFGGGGGSNGGGGASDIRIGDPPFGLEDRVLVAGGGGGSSDEVCPQNGQVLPVSGGDGGGLSGDPGLAGEASGGCAGAVGGGGGTQTAGGSATPPATAGAFGVGGNIDPFSGNGGGGGGGWFGGGGGHIAAGAGGGSGHGPEGTVFETGVRSGDGLATVTYGSIGTLAALVASLSLPRNLEASLQQRLNQAQQELDFGDSFGACDQVAAFIRQVENASGKRISTDDANALIAEADAVRVSLGCGDARTATCAGQAATVVGTGSGDALRGTNGDDVIAAGGGGDLVVGLRGDDLVCGSGGADVIRGKGGDDTLRGGGGKDELRGGRGSDACRGGGDSDGKRHC